MGLMRTGRIEFDRVEGPHGLRLTPCAECVPGIRTSKIDTYGMLAVERKLLVGLILVVVLYHAPA